MMMLGMSRDGIRIGIVVIVERENAFNETLDSNRASHYVMSGSKTYTYRKKMRRVDHIRLKRESVIEMQLPASIEIGTETFRH